MLVLFSTPPGFYYLGDQDYYEAILNMVLASPFHSELRFFNPVKSLGILWKKYPPTD
jgi:hypothetical protein